VNCFFIFGVSPFVYRLETLVFISEEGGEVGSRLEELAILLFTVADVVTFL
jgi:hypothetical protein